MVKKYSLLQCISFRFLRGFNIEIIFFGWKFEYIFYVYRSNMIMNVNYLLLYNIESSFKVYFYCVGILNILN